MSDDNLEDRVEKLEQDLEAVKGDVSWLRQLYNEIVDRLRSAGGQLGRAGKKGDDENKQP
jgi:hypothetical protein